MFVDSPGRMPSLATSPEVSLALPVDPTTSASADAQNLSTLITIGGQYMRNHRKTYSVVVFVLMLAAVVGAKAQTYYGSVRGLVMDKQGATLSQATLTLTNEATHIKRSAETNGAGEYVFTALDPSTYSLAVEATGFKKYEAKGIIIATHQSVTPDLPLTPPQMTQIFHVTPPPPSIHNP